MPLAPRYVPEDWATIARPAIFAWARDAAALLGIASGRVIWKNQAGPSPLKPYVAIGTMAPPNPVGEPWGDGPRAVRVTSVLDATLYRVTLAGVDYDFVSGAGATAAQIVAGLVAVIVAGLGVGAASVSGHFTDVLLLSDDPELIPGDATIETSAELQARLVRYQTGNVEWTVSIDVYADAQAGEPESIAVSASAALQRSLDDEGLLEALRVAGLAVVGVAGARRLPTARDGRWEDRAGFDVRFRALSRVASLSDWIEDPGPLTGTFA